MASAAINADGSTGPVTSTERRCALTALDQNIGTVNDRVDGLARDSLLMPTVRYLHRPMASAAINADGSTGPVTSTERR
ncbi:hypothetical protein C7E17_25005, partial [Stenotrophomonas maltophilia]